jgi:Cu+-exporting ATPase
MTQGFQTHVYYEVAAMVVTLILLGKFLEHHARVQTSEAICKLMGIQAKTARVMRDEVEIDVRIKDVTIN